MNKAYLLLLLLVLLPFVFADTSDLSSGELVADSGGSLALCSNFDNIPAFCKTSLDSKTSGAVVQDDVDSLLNMPSANAELSDAEIVEKKADIATDRLIALYDLFGAFWSLLFLLVQALFEFFQVYLVLWVLFVGIPKLLNYLISVIVKSRGFG